MLSYHSAAQFHRRPKAQPFVNCQRKCKNPADSKINPGQENYQRTHPRKHKVKRIGIVLLHHGQNSKQEDYRAGNRDRNKDQSHNDRYQNELPVVNLKSGKDIADESRLAPNVFEKEKEQPGREWTAHENSVDETDKVAKEWNGRKDHDSDSNKKKDRRAADDQAKIVLQELPAPSHTSKDVQRV